MVRENRVSPTLCSAIEGIKQSVRLVFVQVLRSCRCRIALTVSISRLPDKVVGAVTARQVDNLSIGKTRVRARFSLSGSSIHCLPPLSEFLRLEIDGAIFWVRCRREWVRLRRLGAAVLCPVWQGLIVPGGRLDDPAFQWPKRGALACAQNTGGGSAGITLIAGSPILLLLLLLSHLTQKSSETFRCF